MHNENTIDLAILWKHLKSEPLEQSVKIVQQMTESDNTAHEFLKSMKEVHQNTINLRNMFT